MVLGIVLIIGGGAFGAMLLRGRRELLGRRRALRTGAFAEGTVTAIVTDYLGSTPEREGKAANPGTPIQRLMISFTDAGGTPVVFKERLKPAAGVARGAYFPVHYDPADPKGTATVAAKAVETKLAESLRYCLACGAAVLLGVLIAAGVIPL
ncbi:hypothetical protein ABH926_005312 [Catenulispora sp. GP43]|uniref:DUF3592 domain-containing protein n=1 Tax=Catenulispora sp. GP43 TaxID=3156263 RepID=UPI003514D353